MNIVLKRKVLVYTRIILSVLFFWLYIPHLFFYCICGRSRRFINTDLDREMKSEGLNGGHFLGLIYFLHNNRYFRTIFYHRLGAVISFLIGWWRPGDRYFIISKTTIIGEGAYFAHPYATVINAKSIGCNFSCRHLTTIGNKRDNDNVSRPIIGDNVSLGANVTIIGNIRIGDNVTIGAGSVVVKDIPNNAVAVGNPAKIIRYNGM